MYHQLIERSLHDFTHMWSFKVNYSCNLGVSSMSNEGKNETNDSEDQRGNHKSTMGLYDKIVL